MSVEPMEPFFKEIKEPIELAMTGNYAVAGGVTQTDPDVICAFPITPQTQSVEGLSDVVHQGRLKTAFVNVESEIAAMSYCTGACAAGARTFTATASQGYLLMMEALPMAVGWRVPLTMLISARAFNAPNLNIWNAKSKYNGNNSHRVRLSTASGSSVKYLIGLTRPAQRLLFLKLKIDNFFH